MATGVLIMGERIYKFSFFIYHKQLSSKEKGLEKRKESRVTYKEIANRAEIKVVLSAPAAPSSIISRQESEQA